MMICQDLFQESCPCIRAELAECYYCSLLRDEAVCACDWQGQCLYELYKWHDKPAGEIPTGTVAAVRTFATTTGLIIKADAALTAAPLGTAVSFPLPPAGRPTVNAIILATYPEAGFVHLLLPTVWAVPLLKGQKLSLEIAGNALPGQQALAAAHGQNITLVAAEAFIQALAPLAAALRRQGNRVGFLPAGDDGLPAATDIVLVVGPPNEIKRTATQLPLSFQGKVVILATEGLSPQL